MRCRRRGIRQKWPSSVYMLRSLPAPRATSNGAQGDETPPHAMVSAADHFGQRWVVADFGTVVPRPLARPNCRSPARPAPRWPPSNAGIPAPWFWCPRPKIEADDRAQQPPQRFRHQCDALHPLGKPDRVDHRRSKQAKCPQCHGRTRNAVDRIHEAIKTSTLR